MRNLLILSTMGFLTASGGMATPPQASTQEEADQWEIGPIIRSRNYSVGMPRHPTPAGRGWYFDFPYPDARAGHVHYVTSRPGSLADKTEIVVRYRVEAAQGVEFVPQETPEAPATVSLYFQRRGDNWSGRRQYEFYRWFAPAQTVHEIAPGQHEIRVSLAEGNWTSVMGRPAAAHRPAFRAALAQADRVGLLFGSTSMRGHGVYATGPARFTLISFRIR